ncbi:MAG: DUF5337 domain-containing protein [Rhodobacteraceae bacterium]|nr:DUF5337 domain-containing protein [Paracoccaceae bacterium]
MKEPTPEERAMARQGRMAALVIAGTMLLWIGAQALGARLGWDPALAFVFDIAALAAFVWALAVAARLWQRQRRGGK